MLTLDEFFHDNDVVGSIGCNLDGSPHPGEIWRALRKIEEIDGVDAVYVLVTLFDTPEWPFSDAVRIVTSHNVDTVRSWFPAKLAPDEVWKSRNRAQNRNPYTFLPGCRSLELGGTSAGA
jgi:hypothetical protein